MCERLIVCDGFALAPTEIVGLFDHLQSQPQFFKQVEHKLREEAFLGHIIGKKHASDKGNSRDFEIAGKCYKSNDRSGDTRIIPWAPLDPERTPAGGRLLQSAREWLTSILGEISPSFRSDYPPNESGGSEPLLQCNINLYASADPEPMPLHRDDCSGSQHTFYEAAVTCILYAKSLDGSAVVNDSSASAAEKFGLVLNKPGPTRDSSNAMGKLIGVFGDAYIKGKHMPGSGWDSNDPQSYERMSLNFRVVKKDAWSVLYESPREAGEKTGADS